MRRRALPIALAGALAAAVLTLVAACAGPADTPAASPRAAATATPSATPDPFPRRPLTTSTRYVALGDSFAAGMGGGGETGKCRSSSASYPSVFTRESGVDLIVNAACSGATTSDLLRKQLISLDDRTDLVTVSIGGNDLGVAAIAADCAAGKAASCRSQLTSALSLLNVLPERLATVYDAIVQAAPNARIVVTGYALMYDASDPNAKDFGMAAAINAATIGLNQVIDDAVDAERAKGAPMTYVGVDFAGHAIGDAKPWVHTSGVDAFHPTAAGYAEYARQLVRRLGTAG
ncbi:MULTISPECIES: SGNH/GDSL hydrolase family protein [Leifsonia]|jgi:lysophospholipase L1-like esterase|uniref:Lysophospholipase L1-like esterase n=1 Tax=Leifsonia naganoensis TaxID=150025 RepID=A0A853DZ49_9MICO|nr:SGNH/GDSL hydrolase family protein [Leifsonia naganoensis]NYK12220.1 lysophospholipase L1-like esterase [Leifsonia naganoensis]